jgi:hypothetical protein
VSKEIERTAHETEESIISLFKDMLGKFVGALG